MSEPGSVRVALVLPVDSPDAASAATRIVLFLLRITRSTELALLSDDRFVPAARRALERFGLLFVAANVDLSVDNPAARGQLERLVRWQVERQYARQRIPAVAYDLQIV